MNSLAIVSCSGFVAELEAAVAAEGWPDVVVRSLPAHCGRPPHRWAAIEEALPADCSGILLIGRSCLSHMGKEPETLPPLRIVSTAHCFDLLAPREMVASWIEAGAYLMTPGWLMHWRERLATMGFDAATGAGFFGECCKELLLLDSGTEAAMSEAQTELAEALKLPVKRIPVGLEYLRMRLRAEVLAWRAESALQLREKAEAERRREHADSQATIDMLARLTEAHEEREIANTLEGIFRQLFAPSLFRFLPVEDGALHMDHSLPHSIQLACGSLHEPWAWTPSSHGLLLNLRRNEEQLAVVVAEEFAFPEFRERYLGMALALSAVAALSLEGARTRQRLVEAEKMASLGILVAGVAHEINTPVGICMAAASTLEVQSRQMAAEFAAHTLKQSALSNYLQCAATETRLITNNLERMGRSIESFRQIAVEKNPPVRRLFDFRQLLDQVLESQGRGTLGNALEIAIECAPGLQIESYPGDWATILGNLYSNSLRHGFRGRQKGAIHIAVRKTARSLEVDYRDDGNGLTPEAHEHIFDPFFTTDIQNGMGLGMHLVFNLVKHRFAGSIVCDRHVNHGAHFHLLAPLDLKA